MVYVLSKNGKPLMPTQRYGRVAFLLKNKKAKVVSRNPFTIQLKYRNNEFVQPITLGIDPGYSNIGFSAVSDKKEMICGTFILDSRMSARIKERLSYRQARRHRLKYRKARFMNRRIPKGWIPPSVLHKLYTHVRFINKIKEILPIDKTIVEIANFDITKIVKEDELAKTYLHGELYEYNNLISYLTARENGRCQFCRNEQGSDSWDKIYIVPLENGGTNTTYNVALVHAKCKNKIIKDGLYRKIKKSKQFKKETFMNVLRWRILENIGNHSYTFGYLTHLNRKKLSLDKTHYNDAFVIAGGTTQRRLDPIQVRQIRKHNRQLQLNRNGYDRAIIKNRYPLRPYDIVKCDGKIYMVKGVHSYGKRVNLYSENAIVTKYTEKVTLVKYSKSINFLEKRFYGVIASKFNQSE